MYQPPGGQKDAGTTKKLMRSASPHAFIQNWLAAQARDLDSMLGYQIGVPGGNGGSVTEEDLRRSELFTLPWVEEAIH